MEAVKFAEWIVLKKYKADYNLRDGTLFWISKKGKIKSTKALYIKWQEQKKSED